MHAAVPIRCLGTGHFLGNFLPRFGILYLGIKIFQPKSFQTIANEAICYSCIPLSMREIWERKLSKKSLLEKFRVKSFLAELQRWHQNCDIKGVNSVWDQPVPARACPGFLPPFRVEFPPLPVEQQLFQSGLFLMTPLPCRAFKCHRQIFQLLL